jgi:hypothetical protein
MGRMQDWRAVRAQAVNHLSPRQRRTVALASANRTMARLREFDPDEPRDDQGQWTSGGGGDGEGSGGGAAGPAASVFVSPNIGELTFDQAHSGLGSERQQALRAAGAEIDRAIGRAPASSRDVIGAWKDGAENSIMLRMPGWSPTQARAAAAMRGWLGDQKSALVFEPGHGGHAFLAMFPASGKVDAIHKQLLDQGLTFHTLEPTPTGALVHVFGEDQAAADAVGKAAASYGAKTSYTFGHGEFIGTTKADGTDREQRDDARRQYEAVIGEAAAAPELRGRDVAGAWNDLRNRWGGKLSQIGGVGVVSAVDGYHPGVKTPGTTGTVGQATAVKAAWIKASPIKTIEDVKRFAAAGQQQLGDVGRSIADKLGLDPFKDPGPKTKSDSGVARVQFKAKQRGGNLAAVTDTVRGTFLVQNPAQADQIIGELGKHFEVAAEPWKQTDMGYADRSANVRLPNGIIGEIQMMHPDMAAAKSDTSGGGHTLYVEARTAAPNGEHPDPAKYAAAVAKQRELYGKALAGLGPDWQSAVYVEAKGARVKASGIGRRLPARAADQGRTGGSSPPT